MSDPIVVEVSDSHASAVHFSADGKTLATAGMDNRVRLWRTDDWTELRTLAGHEKGANCVVMTRDGKTLISGSSDRTVRIWDVDSGAVRHVCEGHKNTVPAVRLSADERWAASSDYHGRIFLWDVSTGAEIARARPYKRNVTGIAFHPDNETLLACGLGGPIVRLRLPDLEELGPFTDNGAAFHGIRRTPDGAFAAASFDGDLWFWSARGEPLRHFRVDEKRMGFFSFSPDAGTVAVSVAQRVRLLDPTDGTVQRDLEVGLKGVYATSWSPDGKRLALAAADGRVRIWNI